MDNTIAYSYWDIEVSPKMYVIIKDLFETIGLKLPPVITSYEMEQALNHLKRIVNHSESLNPSQSNHFKLITNKGDSKIKLLTKITNALIISDLGVIRYQAKNLFTHKKIVSTVSESLYAGLAEYVKKLHDIVIIDISNKDKEVLDVIDEINRISRLNSIKTKIVLFVPQKENNETLRFRSKGVDKYIFKESCQNWYDELAKYISTLII